MQDIKLILNLSTLLFEFAVFSYAWGFISMSWNFVRYKEPFNISELNFFKHIMEVLRSGKLLKIVFVFCVLVGGVNLLLSNLYSNTKMGSLYEASEYDASYEALIYINGTPSFCIADISRRVDYEEDARGNYEREYNYWIEEIHLPYGNTEYIGDIYYPDDDINTYSLGEWGYSCDLVLREPVTDISYKLLEAEIVSSYGDFCGSRNSTIYHLLDCPTARNISDSNYIYFSDIIEADILGYSACKLCAADF